HVMDEALTKFLDPDIPAWGDSEEEIDRPFWRVADEGSDPALPGGGLARHDMLYIGEGCNRMFLIKDGKIIWTYCTGKGWEYDDIWMMTNGNILFSRMYWAAEVTPTKEVVWRMEAPEGTEIHAVQPLGLDRVLVLVNEVPAPRVLIINKKTGETQLNRVIPYWGGGGTHGQNRRIRYTTEGTFLVPYLSDGKVVEFDKDFNEIWSYDVGKPWAAIRLKNGNTLISDESDESVVEVTPDKQVVWRFCVDELPEEIRLSGTQSCVRLDNGNTILCARGNGGRTPQLVEITPNKEVVWVLKDWKNLGPATAVQILYDGGIPENPGECQR
ncbi:MAG: hypothetical protein IJX76_08475, partial [Clostridia bacterium]|nr:hypothetical protein [Clostridia bacterium]